MFSGDLGFGPYTYDTNTLSSAKLSLWAQLSIESVFLITLGCRRAFAGVPQSVDTVHNPVQSVFVGKTTQT